MVGTSVPLGLFLVWNAVILGSISGLEMSTGQIVDPLQQLRSSNGAVGVSFLSSLKVLALLNQTSN